MNRARVKRAIMAQTVGTWPLYVFRSPMREHEQFLIYDFNKIMNRLEVNTILRLWHPRVSFDGLINKDFWKEMILTSLRPISDHDIVPSTYAPCIKDVWDFYVRMGGDGHVLSDTKEMKKMFHILIRQARIIIGALSYTIDEEKGVVVITNVVVEYGQRQQGFGTFLFVCLIKLLVGSGVKPETLYVQCLPADSLDTDMDFYTQLGFTVLSTEVNSTWRVHPDFTLQPHFFNLGNKEFQVSAAYVDDSKVEVEESCPADPYNLACLSQDVLDLLARNGSLKKFPVDGKYVWLKLKASDFDIPNSRTIPFAPFYTEFSDKLYCRFPNHQLSPSHVQNCFRKLPLLLYPLENSGNRSGRLTAVPNFQSSYSDDSESLRYVGGYALYDERYKWVNGAPMSHNILDLLLSTLSFDGTVEYFPIHTQMVETVGVALVMYEDLKADNRISTPFQEIMKEIITYVQFSWEWLYRRIIFMPVLSESNNWTGLFAASPLNLLSKNHMNYRKECCKEAYGWFYHDPTQRNNVLDSRVGSKENTFFFLLDIILSVARTFEKGIAPTPFPSWATIGEFQMWMQHVECVNDEESRLCDQFMSYIPAGPTHPAYHVHSQLFPRYLSRHFSSPFFYFGKGMFADNDAESRCCSVRVLLMLIDIDIELKKNQFKNIFNPSNYDKSAPGMEINLHFFQNKYVPGCHVLEVGEMNSACDVYAELEGGFQVLMDRLAYTWSVYEQHDVQRKERSRFQEMLADWDLWPLSSARRAGMSGLNWDWSVSDGTSRVLSVAPNEEVDEVWPEEFRHWVFSDLSTLEDLEPINWCPTPDVDSSVQDDEDNYFLHNKNTPDSTNGVGLLTSVPLSTASKKRKISQVTDVHNEVVVEEEKRTTIPNYTSTHQASSEILKNKKTLSGSDSVVCPGETDGSLVNTRGWRLQRPTLPLQRYREGGAKSAAASLVTDAVPKTTRIAMSNELQLLPVQPLKLPSCFAQKVSSIAQTAGANTEVEEKVTKLSPEIQAKEGKTTRLKSNNVKPSGSQRIIAGKGEMTRINKVIATSPSTPNATENITASSQSPLGRKRRLLVLKFTKEGREGSSNGCTNKSDQSEDKTPPPPPPRGKATLKHMRVDLSKCITDERARINQGKSNGASPPLVGANAPRSRQKRPLQQQTDTKRIIGVEQSMEKRLSTELKARRYINTSGLNQGIKNASRGILIRSVEPTTEHNTSTKQTKTQLEAVKSKNTSSPKQQSHNLVQSLAATESGSTLGKPEVFLTNLAGRLIPLQAFYKTENPCIHTAFASAMHYAGICDYAKRIYDQRLYNDSLKKNQILFLTETLTNNKFGFAVTRLRNKHREMGTIIHESLNSPINNTAIYCIVPEKDDEPKHAICILNGLIFDSTRKTVFRLTKANLKMLCPLVFNLKNKRVIMAHGRKLTKMMAPRLKGLK